MNERELRRRFPRATEAFIQRNKDRVYDKPSPTKSELMVRKSLEKTMDKRAMEKHYSIKRVDVVFRANHGIELDEDNRRFIVKPLLDAIVSLGFEASDKEIKTDVHQRMDKDNSHI